MVLTTLACTPTAPGSSNNFFFTHCIASSCTTEIPQNSITPFMPKPTRSATPDAPAAEDDGEDDALLDALAAENRAISADRAVNEYSFVFPLAWAAVLTAIALYFFTSPIFDVKLQSAENQTILAVTALVTAGGLFVAVQRSLRGWWKSTALKYGIKTIKDSNAATAARAAVAGAAWSTGLLFLFSVWVLGWSFFRPIEGIADSVYNALLTCATSTAITFFLERVFYISGADE